MAAACGNLGFPQAGGVDLVLLSSFNLETEITMEHDVDIEPMIEDTEEQRS